MPSTLVACLSVEIEELKVLINSLDRHGLKAPTCKILDRVCSLKTSTTEEPSSSTMKRSRIQMKYRG